MRNWNVRKTIVAREAMPEHHRLAQSLSGPHRVALGVGAIVGTGILTLTGVGAAKAGPAVILSFAIAGVICACAALAYAEMATMYPASGSAYTYSYVVFGELIAWVVGWSLILEYSLVVSAVAVGWSGYASGFLESVGMGMPAALTNGPELGGIVNLPAIFIIAVVAGLLIYGTRESATLNAFLVVVKLLALALFIGPAMIVGRLGTGLLFDILPARLVAACAFALPALACLWLWQLPLDATSASILAVLIGIGMGSEVDVVAYLSSRYFDTRHYGLVFGILISLYGAAIGTSAWLVGRAFDAYGTYDPALMILVAGIAIAVALVVSLGRAAPREVRAEPRPA